MRQLIRRAEHTISTHAPRTGSDATQAVNPVTYTTFQPTLPARGATDFINTLLAQYGDFNPRSPHGERRSVSRLRLPRRTISTHAPRTGSDRKRRRKPPPTPQFQPTLPARGATRVMRSAFSGRAAFQPTLPARGATRSQRGSFASEDISTHAPRTGSDTARPENGGLEEISTHAPRTGSDVPRR